MSTELAQDEDDADGRDAEAYDLEAIERGRFIKDDGDSEGGIKLHGGELLRTPVGEDNVVFEIGDEDEDDRTPGDGRRSANANDGYEIGEDDGHESQGLMRGTSPRTDKRND